MVPHLVTALTSPINELEQRLLDAMPAIERWFRLEWMEHTPAFYCSVDIRNAGFKLAPVSTNLFPGSWQNLTPGMLPLAVQAAMAAIEKICPEAKNLLLIPENGQRNPAYLANLAQLRRIFNMAGLNVRIGSIDPDIKANTTVDLPDGQSITFEPVHRIKGRLVLKHFDPCTILLNNNLAAGAPGILEDLHTQYLLPPLHAGASVRQRSRHLQCYDELSKRFGKLVGIDNWLINPIYSRCSELDFSTGKGLEALRTQVDGVLTKVRRKYKEYGIAERPFAVVKTDNSARSLGTLLVRDAKELDGLLEHYRSASGLTGVHNVLVQEGVLTQERMNESVAEPVVTMMDRYVVGGFYRIHAQRGADQNLNTPGSSYVPLAFETSAHLPQPGVKPGASAPNRFYMYGVVGRMAMLAASYELEATDPNAETYE